MNTPLPLKNRNRNRNRNSPRCADAEVGGEAFTYPLPTASFVLAGHDFEWGSVYALPRHAVRKCLPTGLEPSWVGVVSYTDVSTLTRGQVAARCGLTLTELASCERLGAISPTFPGEVSTRSRALYTELDAATARVIADAHRLGLRGKSLLALRHTLDEVLPQLRGTTRGWVVVCGTQAHFVTSIADLGGWVSATPPGLPSLCFSLTPVGSDG